MDDELHEVKHLQNNTNDFNGKIVTKDREFFKRVDFHGVYKCTTERFKIHMKNIISTDYRHRKI